MVDEYEDVEERVCIGCPDRTVEPNCHDSCEGYKKRKLRIWRQNREINTGYAPTAYKNSCKKVVRV